MKTPKWLVLSLMVIFTLSVASVLQGCGKKDTSSTFYGAAS